MTKLTPTQTALLAAAAEVDDGVVEHPEGAHKTIASLVKRGLLISLPQPGGPDHIMISKAGRLAIGETEAPATAPEPAISQDPPAPPPKAASQPKGKLGEVIILMRRDSGATIADLMTATGWQAHSVRGAISGAVKKKLGLNVASEKGEGERVYRIVDGAGA
jgi:hypothetical protein